MILVDNLHNYFKNEFNLSKIESAKLKYSLEIIFNDLSKLLILFFFFSIVGKKSDFIYSAITLLLLRPFTGGLHFKTYYGCLFFTVVFFISCITFKNYFSINSLLIIFLLFIFLAAIILFFAPITSKSRPAYSDRKKQKFKLLSLIILFIHFFLFLFYKNNPYLMNSIWIMILQSIQLLIAKGVEIYEKNKIIT